MGSSSSNLIKNLIKRYLVFVIFLLPFVQLWSVFSPYEIPKAWFVIILTEVLVVLTLFGYRTTSSGYDKHIWLPLLLLFTLTTSSILSSTLLTSLLGNPSRFDGLFTLGHLVIFTTSIGLVWSKSWDRIVAQAIAIGSIGVSLWNLLGILFPVLVPESARWQGAVAIGFGNPNILAGYLVTTLPFILWLVKSTTTSHRMWWIIGLMTELLAILMTKSWGGLLGVLTCFLIFFTNKWNWKKIIVSLLLVIVVVGLYAYDYESRLLPLQVVAESRQRIIMKGLIAITQKPLFGWGWAQFPVAFTQIDWPEHFYTEAYVDRAHSSILELAVSGGFVSLIIYLIIIATSIWKLMRGSNFARIVGMSLIVYLIHSQTNVTSVAQELFMWFAVGIGNNTSQPKI